MGRWFQYFREYTLAVFVRGGGPATSAVTLAMSLLGFAGIAVVFFFFSLDFESVLLSFLGFLGIVTAIYWGGFVAYRDERRWRVALQSGPVLILEYLEGPEFQQIDKSEHGELHTFRVSVRVGGANKSVDEVRVQIKEIEPVGSLRGCPHDLHRMNDNVRDNFERSRTVNPGDGILFDVLSYYLDYANGVDSLQVSHISRGIEQAIAPSGVYTFTITATGKDVNPASLCLRIQANEKICVSECQP